MSANDQYGNDVYVLFVAAKLLPINAYHYLVRALNDEGRCGRMRVSQRRSRPCMIDLLVLMAIQQGVRRALPRSPPT